jgi:hypothetical protein
MKIIKKNISISIYDMPIGDICSYYKFIGIDDARLAYDEYLIDSALKPLYDSKEFQSIFKSAKSIDIRQEINFLPNVFDKLRKMRVSAQRSKVTRQWHMVWEDGTCGTYPAMYPPDPERFVNYYSKNEK